MTAPADKMSVIPEQAGMTARVTLVLFPVSDTIEGMTNAVLGLCYIVLLSAAGEVAPTLLTANEHPWGSFQPKSWCIVQTTIVSDLDGRVVRSVQTVKTTLKSIDESGVTLEESETLELGGKTVEKKPQMTKFDFFQERIHENTQVRQGTPVKLLIDKKGVPCSVRIYEQQTAGGHLTTTVFYSPLVYPYVLRVETVLRSAAEGENAGGQIIRQSAMFVQETSALRAFRTSRRYRTYSMQTVEKTGNITKITDARCSWDVPGGLLESTTRELDNQNKEIRRSVSRMTNYSAFEPVPMGLPQRYYRTLVPVEGTPQTLLDIR